MKPPEYDQPPVAGQDYWLLDEYRERARPPMAHRPVDPYTAQPSLGERLGAVAVAVLFIAVLFAACLFLPDRIA